MNRSKFPLLCPYLFLRDVRRFKDVRKEFERSSETLEGALVRNVQAPRGKIARSGGGEQRSAQRAQGLSV